MTRIQSSSTTIGLFTAAGSAFAGYFAASSAAPRSLSNAAPRSFASAAVALYDATVVAPICTSAVSLLPVDITSLMCGTPRFTSAAFATSHGDVNFDVPTGLNWTEQTLAGPVTTFTGAVVWAASSAGL